MRSRTRGLSAWASLAALAIVAVALGSAPAHAAETVSDPTCANEGLLDYFFPVEGVSQYVAQCGNARGELVLVNLTHAVVAVRDPSVPLLYPDQQQEDWEIFQTHIAAIDSSVLVLFPRSKVNLPQRSAGLTADVDFRLSVAYGKFKVMQDTVYASADDGSRAPAEATDRLADFLLSNAAGACVKAAYKSSKLAVAVDEASDFGDVFEVTRDSLKIPKVWKACKAEWKTFVKRLSSVDGQAVHLSPSLKATLTQDAVVFGLAREADSGRWWRPIASLFSRL